MPFIMIHTKNEPNSASNVNEEKKVLNFIGVVFKYASFFVLGKAMSGKKRKLSVKSSWLENEHYKAWLRRDRDDSARVWCNVCQKSIQADLTAIKRHQVKY